MKTTSLLCFFISLYCSLTPVKAGCTPCPGGCICADNNGGGCTVNCSGRGFFDVPLFNGTRSDVTNLILTNNEITRIFLSSFDRLPNLTTLHLENNRINQIEVGAFINLKSLTELNLANNQLTTLPDEIYYLPLNKVFLAHNNWICNCTNARFQNWLKANSDIVEKSKTIACSEPTQYRNASITSASIDLSHCAQSLISCHVTNNDFVLWDALHSSVSLNETSCMSFCFSGNYYYSLWHNQACLCANEQSTGAFKPDVKEWQACNLACSNQQSMQACNRKIARGTVKKALPELEFVGIRCYLRTEEVVIEVNDRNRITEKYMWYFNDTTPYQMRDGTTITHKFAVPETYWITVTAYSNGKGMHIESFALVVEEAIGGLELQCPIRTTANRTELRYTLRKGTNPQLRWSRNSDKMLLTAEDFSQPHCYVSGSTIFDKLSEPLVNLKALNRTASNFVSTNEEKFVLLFPGMWTVDDGTLHSWELVVTATQRTIRVQIYRPTCASPQKLLLPGCRKDGSTNPFASCSTTLCSVEKESCQAGFQYCYFNKTKKHCRTPLSSCNWYSESGAAAGQLRHLDTIPTYKFVKEFYLAFGRSSRGLYQILLDEGVDVQADDVIAVAFEKTRQHTNISLTDIPVGCSSSSNSIWRQSALLFSVNTSEPIDLDAALYPHQWLDEIWCDIRFHYSKKSQDTVSVSLGEITPGEYTYFATAANQISNQSVECTVVVEDTELDVTVLGSSVIDGIPTVYVEKNKPTNVSVQIRTFKGQENVLLSLTDIEKGSTNQGMNYEADCDITGSSTCSKVVNKSLTINEAGNTTFSILARSADLSARTTLKLIAEEGITGAKIFPENVSRILVGTYQEFTFSTDTGTNITTSWVVDGLQQFKYTRPTFSILFRTPLNYQITTTIANHISEHNITTSLQVDDMNRFSGLTFNGDLIVERGKNSSFFIQVNVDENVDATVEWYVDSQSVTYTRQYTQPHGGARPQQVIEQVTLTDTVYHTFTSSGNKSIKVIVRNDYDSAELDQVVQSRSRLTGADIKPLTGLFSNTNIKFELSGLPSSDGCTYNVDWGDGSENLNISSSAVTHNFASRNVYRVTVTANNVISQATSQVNISIYDEITGLSISSNEPTEFGYETIISASINSGNDSFALYTFDLGNSNVIANQSNWTLTYTYSAVGQYNVTVTVANPSSTTSASIQVDVFEFEIKDIRSVFACYETGDLVELYALMPVDSVYLFGFNWTFGDDPYVMSIEGDNNVTHVYSSPNRYVGKLVAYSKLSQDTDTKNFTVCVQSTITGVNLTYEHLARKTGEVHKFNYQVDGGTEVIAVIDYGDGTVEENNGTSGVLQHVYNASGNYTVAINASNLVSSSNNFVEVIVQDIISITNITTSSGYHFNVPAGEAISYTVTYTGSRASLISWNFGQGFVEYSGVDGETVAHTYAGPDDITIKVNVSNLVSSQVNNANIRIYSPVGGVSFKSLPDIIAVGDKVWLNVTTSRHEKIFWKITPSTTTNWDHISQATTYLHTFTRAGLFNVTVKSENEASAEFASAIILVAELLGNRLDIDAYNTSVVNGIRYGAVGENSAFEVKLNDGSNISTTTSGNTTYLSYAWTFYKDGNVIFTNSSSLIVEYKFVDEGEYTLLVNVSNTVSTSVKQVTLRIIQRVENVSLSKLDPPENAVATFVEARINVTTGRGTYLSYRWYDGSILHSANIPHLFTETKTQPGTYNISVVVSNPLGSVTSHFELIVQDEVQGLKIQHLNSIQEFYVALYDDTYFRADVTQGSDVTYTWSFIDVSSSNVDSHNTTVSVYKWNFTKVATYVLMLEGSNLVSSKAINTTVYVLEPISENIDFKILPRKFAQPNETITINVTVQTKSGAWFSCDFGDGSALVNTTDLSMSFETTHSYDTDGVYDILMLAYNNASRVNVTETVFVREYIDGLNITGCNPDAYVRSDLTYNLTASITSGTAVQFNWTIIYRTGQTENYTGVEWSLQMDVAGVAFILLQASNEINTRIKNITITIQEPPDVDINLLTTGFGNIVYVNETIEIEIVRRLGTDLICYVNFDDGNVITNGSSLQYQNAFIDPGVYVINVTVYNQVGSVQKSIKLTVSELACEQPRLSFVGSGASQTKFYRSRQVLVETEIQTFGCKAYVLKYRWHFYLQDTCSNLSETNKVTLPLSTAYSPLLSLPPLTLSVGKYCATNTASYVGPSLSHTISTTVEVIASPLAVIITGGTQRQIPQSTEVRLDASSSFDPDLEPGKQTALRYQWRCEAKPRSSTAEEAISTVNVDDNCFDFEEGKVVVLEKNRLLPQFEYNFTVTASKTGKIPQSAWQSIIIVSDSRPTVTITCQSCRQQSSLKISSAFHLKLKGSCDSNCWKGDVRYLWEATRRLSSSEEAVSFPLNRETTTTGNNHRYLVVRVFALLLYCEYEFKLTITVNGVSGVSKLVLFSNKAPQAGTCSMTYEGNQVYVLETPVQFSCSGWTDDDVSPLIYTILAKRYRNNEQSDDFLIYKGTSSDYEAYLPIGFADNQFNIQIQILVEDQLGTYSIGLNETLNVKLNENVDTIAWLRNKTSVELVELVKSSNPQVVADYAAGLITVLNQNSEAHASSIDDPDFEFRKEIRSNITQSVALLSTSTFAEIQQVAAVFKQCMKVPAELQDEEIHNISLAKLGQLAQQMPNYVSVATQTSFLAVTNDLVGIVSYLVDSINYQVYFGSRTSQTYSTLSEEYRKERVESLLESAFQLTDNVLEGRVEGEEPVFFNATAFSSLGGRITPSTMNSSLSNDGCVMELPEMIFSTKNLSDDTEIFYIFFVSQQNPYTFGYIPSQLDSEGIANITTRVPSLQFKYPNRSVLAVNSLGSSVSGSSGSSAASIKMVMAPSERVYIEEADTGQLAELSDGNQYLPRSSVNFEYVHLSTLNSVAMAVSNNNTDPNTAMHIMIVFDRLGESDRTESRPYIDVYFDTTEKPNESRHNQYFRLTEETVAIQADHRGYTVFLDPNVISTTSSFYYLNISSYFEFDDVRVGIATYYSSCQFFDTQTGEWSVSGLSTSSETLPSAAVCYSEHLTSFGSFVINPPNTVDVTDIVNIDFAQNPVALSLVLAIFGIFLIVILISYRLDKRDVAHVSAVPLCGPNHSFKYEITVKTSPGIGSGTTANVGICVYGYESRSGSRHLYYDHAFQRGAVDVFQIATDVSLGTIYKVKIWHDNTGLDPGWNVSRVMVKDLQTDEKYYFLIDSWLQVYPDDENETCLQKTVRAASDEEMSDFSTRFGNQLSYGWEDAHLWLSLIERPPRSSFTRVQRATCCVTLLYMFMLFSAVWYQGVNDEREEFGVNLAQDIAVGAIVSLMVFPANLIIVFLFKKSKSKVTPTTTYIPNRAQTAQTVEILDEVLDGRSRKSTVSRMFPFSHFGFSETSNSIRREIPGNTEDMFELTPSQLSSSEDTGIYTGVSSTPSNDSGTRLRRRNTSYPHRYDDDEDDDFGELWDPFVSEGSLKSDDVKSTRPSNLRRTQKAKFQQSVPAMSSEDDIKEELQEIFEDANDDANNDTISTATTLHRQRSVHSPDSSIGEPIIVTSSRRRFTLPSSSPMYLAYTLCIVGSAVSIFYIILYGHSFGVDLATRWLVSMLIALLESLFIIEPLKVLFLAIYIAMFTKNQTPEQNDNIVDEPLLHIDDDCCESGGGIQKGSKIRPPGGFALEQCKDQVKKSTRARKYLLHFGVHLVFFWSVFAFCMWDRSYISHHSTNSLHNAILDKPIVRSGEENITFEQIRTDADMWAWLTGVFEPNVLNKGSLFYDNTNNLNVLLGQARIRQQRYMPADRCPASNSPSWPNLAPNFLCLSPSVYQDKESYFPGWLREFNGSSSVWSHFPTQLTGYGYWGNHRIYDDSGYSVYLDGAVSGQLTALQNQGWTDRVTSVVFLEFTQYNPATYWFIVSVLMFEFEPTGVVSPSHITQTVHLFSPSSAFYIDQFFIVLIGLICIFYWAHEIVKFARAWRYKGWRGAWKVFNFLNIFVVLLTTTICILFIYKLVYLEEVMLSYKSNRNIFTNFYGVAFISNTIIYLAGFLFAILIIKSLKFFRFFRWLCKFEETLSRAFSQIFSATIMLLVLVLAFAQLGYLIYGLNSTSILPEFRDFHNSFYVMIRAFNRNVNFKPYYDVMPAFTILFFLSYYLGIFLIFCRLFAAILIKEYKHTSLAFSKPHTNTTEYDIMEYMIQRLKMRLGLVKPKQFRPTVHFEGMSNHSSESSFISIDDSLGSCFTLGRMSQCSDASGISSTDSGMDSPSDHSISLFDYLTLEHPPFGKPMDDLHLDYLYDRLSTYSVDMMIHKLDRVNKLGDDVLSIESKLLEVSQRREQKKILQKESSEIAKAVSNTSGVDSRTGSNVVSGSSGKLNLSSTSLSNLENSGQSGQFPIQVGGNIDSLLEKPTGRVKIHRPPVRSSSYVDPSMFPKEKKTSMARSTTKSDATKRPHSDEGARAFASQSSSAIKGVIKKKSAW